MKAIDHALTGLALGEAQQFRNLTAFPLLNPQAGAPGYVTLSEAVARGTASIREISEGGSVPELLLDNQGATRVLILDGEELIGAKQNRIANLTVLGEAHSTTVLPVSCVEHGRWGYNRHDFEVSECALFSRARAMKSRAVSSNLKATGTYGGNQSEVWDNISAKHDRMGVYSRTAAMADMYEQHRDRLEDYATNFRAVEHQVGVLFAIDGEIEGMDLFDAHATLETMLPKLARSFAIDALESNLESNPESNADSTAGPHKTATADTARRFLDRVAAAHIDTYSGVGVGSDLRLSAPLVAGGGLADGDKLIHLAAFSAPGPDASGERIRETRLHSQRYDRMRNRRNDH